MKYLDCVEIIVEKEKYAKEGVHKGRLMRVELITPTNNNFLPFLASSLVIRRYYCVLRLHTFKNLYVCEVEEFLSAAFFERRSVKFAVRLSPYKNKRKQGGKRRRAKP